MDDNRFALYSNAKATVQLRSAKRNLDIVSGDLMVGVSNLTPADADLTALSREAEEHLRKAGSILESLIKAADGRIR